jgi:hypothetical protein
MQCAILAPANSLILHSASTRAGARILQIEGHHSAPGCETKAPPRASPRIQTTRILARGSLRPDARIVMNQLGHPYRTPGAAPPVNPPAAAGDDATAAFTLLAVLTAVVCGLRILVAWSLHERFTLHSDAMRAALIGAGATGMALRAQVRLRRQAATGR